MLFIIGSVACGWDTAGLGLSLSLSLGQGSGVGNVFQTIVVVVVVFLEWEKVFHFSKPHFQDNV